MELQCDVCFVNFDVDHHRPKVLPCGHTICKECVENPALQKKCPTCRKGLGRNTNNLPDNVIVVRMIEQGGAPPLKKPRTEDSVVQQLQRGVDACKKVVEQLQQVVPQAVAALNCQLDSAVAQLRQMEEALEQQVQREAAGVEGAPPDLTQQLQLVVGMEQNFRLLTTMCSVVAEEEAGAAWRVSSGSVQLDVVRVLLLQVQTDGQLEKADAVTTPGNPAPAAFVGPPLISSLSIRDNDLDGGVLKVNDIIRDRARWRDTRCIKGLKGVGSEQLLRVLAPQLEELEIKKVTPVTPSIMTVIQQMASLKRLGVTCIKEVNDYPPLPLQLEELRITCPSESQLRSVEHMPRLRSLNVWNYHGPNVTFTPSRHGALRWLAVCFNISHKVTMLSLIRSHAASLQELHVLSNVNDEGVDRDWYFPDLGEDLAASGLLALRRLVLLRPAKTPCTDQAAACYLQLGAIRDILPLSIEVACSFCIESTC